MSQSGSFHKSAGARLILQGGTTRAVALDPLPFSIGRRVAADLALEDPRISREHAVIDRDVAGYFLRDLGSRHGTCVNGARVAAESVRLRSGDVLSLGERAVTLLFEEFSDGSETVLSLLTQSSHARSSANELQMLTLFLKAAQRLNGYGALDDVLRVALEYTIRLTHAERGFVFLGSTPDSLRLARGQDARGDSLAEFPGVSRSVLQEAILSGLDFLLDDTASAAGVPGQASLDLHAIRSVAAIPLRGTPDGRLLGLLYLDSQSARRHFGATDHAILRAISQQVALLLQSFHMLERERETALLRKELEIAAAIQRQILPTQLPDFPFARVAAHTSACTAVGGDFYDVLPTPGGFVALLADVCGKGIPAALLAAMAQGMLHAQLSGRAATGAALIAAVDTLNRFVCERSPPEKYLTLIVLGYTPQPGGGARVELINGGHVAPIVVRAGGLCETHADSDMPVGLLPFASFHTSVIHLAPGDRLVLLSDGITEAEDPAGEQFCAQQLEPALAPAAPIAHLLSALQRFTDGSPAQDDQTIMAIDAVT